MIIDKNCANIVFTAHTELLVIIAPYQYYYVLFSHKCCVVPHGPINLSLSTTPLIKVAMCSGDGLFLKRNVHCIKLYRVVMTDSLVFVYSLLLYEINTFIPTQDILLILLHYLNN